MEYHKACHCVCIYIKPLPPSKTTSRLNEGRPKITIIIEVQNKYQAKIT